MGHFLFFVFVVMAGLLWTAACTAAAARVTREWLKALLAAAGAGGPVIVILPVVAATWWLAFGVRISANWFPHAITTLVSLLIGGAWIVRAGLVPRGGGEPPAARWPLVGLAALFAIAAAVTVGVLLILDNAVAAQAAYLRLEAANLMQSNLPPLVADDENAAPLHLQAGAAIAADTAFGGEDSPIAREGDVMREAVAVFLARHAGTLDLVRQAADRDTCRFTRDWSRPGIDMILPETQGFRSEGRLLALAARRAAAEGRHADALADVVRIGRLGRHAASEPIIVSTLVALAMESQALSMLADILPQLGRDDAPLLDSPGIRMLVSQSVDLLPALYGEEAFGLSAFAGFADGRMASADVLEPQDAPAMACDVGPIFRVFFLSGDVDGYRRLMHRSQQLAARRAGPRDQVTTNAELDAIEKELTARPPGILSRLLFPAIRALFQARARSEARHRAAAVLVAATEQRLETGMLPLEPAAFGGTPPFVPPADPFAAGGTSLAMKRSDAGLAVYSVGPDGQDDGGPAPSGEDRVEDGNDDVGLVMAIE